MLHTICGSVFVSYKPYFFTLPERECNESFDNIVRSAQMLDP